MLLALNWVPWRFHRFEAWAPTVEPSSSLHSPHCFLNAYIISSIYTNINIYAAYEPVYLHGLL